MLEAHGVTLISSLAGLTVGLLVLGLFRTNRTRNAPDIAVRRRFNQLHTPEEGDPLVQSFASRVVRPMIAGAVRVVTRVLPTGIVASLNETIEMAGRPTTVNRFLATWIVAALGLPLVLALMLISLTGGIRVMQLAPIVLWSAVALYVPWTGLRRKAKARIKQIGRDLPDAIDLIITNVEAGLGMQSALQVVSQKFGGPVGEEFGRVVREISLGADRTEALVTMAERSGVPDMRLFARSVAQAEQTGIPVARVLRNHSAEVREKRRQKAREQAAKIPVKITFPTVLIMFPTLFLLILGPVALNLMEQFGQGGGGF